MPVRTPSYLEIYVRLASCPKQTSYSRKIEQKKTEDRGLLIASQFGFCACRNTTFHCMRLTDHVTVNFSNNMSMAAVFLDIEKAFATSRHLGLLYKFSELKFSISPVKLISSFLSQRKFRISVESQMTTPRGAQGSVLSRTLYSTYTRISMIHPKQLLSIWVSFMMVLVYTIHPMYATYAKQC
jgi:hypothetical protein